MEHKSVTSPHGTTHYWVSRAGGEEKVKTLVFTHGLTADHRMFEKQVQFFEGKFDLILWDVPLHGLSRPYTDFSYRSAAVELNSILLAEKVEQAVLVGMSMGGYPAQMFGALYPQKTLGFAALDTTPFGICYYSRSDMWWLRQVAPLAQLFPVSLLKKSMAKSVSATQYSCDTMLKMLGPLSKKTIVEQMGVAYGGFLKENFDASFEFPVLILVGENDRTGKVKRYCEAWAARTGYPLVVIPGAAHFSNGDAPERVNREILSFVQNLS